jgi:hypothetical protein
MPPKNPQNNSGQIADAKAKAEQDAKDKAAAAQKAKDEQETADKAAAEQKAKDEQEAADKAAAAQKAKDEQDAKDKAAAAQKAKDEQDELSEPHIVVIGPKKGRWRAGRHFGPEPTIILVSDLIEGEGDALRSDPTLAISVVQ